MINQIRKYILDFNLSRALFILISMASVLVLSNGCKDDYSLIEDVPLSKMSLPTLKINDINTVTQSSAQVIVDIESDGGGRVTVSGVCWSKTNTMPTLEDDLTSDGFNDGEFRSFIKELDLNTTYYVRPYATNAKGTAFGEVKQFTTTAPLAVLTTLNVSEITQISAIVKASFEQYGETVTMKGVCWSITDEPTIDDFKTEEGGGGEGFLSLIENLEPGVSYKVRAYAINSAGVAYGQTLTFTTKAPTVTDIDGNIYHTIKIGTQTWMLENLKVTHYRNGDPIGRVNQPSDWDTIEGRYGIYDNNQLIADVAGNLYNWHAGVDPRNIAPVGWRVPTDNDWTKLITYLGGESVAGGKLKSIDPQHWASPNAGATNSSGFSAVGGGQAGMTSLGANLFLSGIYWTSGDVNAGTGLLRILSAANAQAVYSGGNKKAAFSVRLIKDE